MQNPKFEKEVQRKMHDLEFVPSEAVWENVLRNVAPRRRRRMAAAFWWLAPGLLALGAGGLFYLHGHSRQALAVNGAAGKTGRAAVAHVAAKAGNEESGSGSGASGNRHAALAGKDGVGGQAGGNKSGGIGETGNSVAGMEKTGNSVAGMKKTGKGGEAGKAGESIEARGTGENGEIAGSMENGSGSKALASPAYRGWMSRFLPRLIGGFASRSDITAPDLYPGPPRTAVSGIRQPARPWRAAFVAGAGASSIEVMTAPMQATAASPTSIFSNSTNPRNGAYTPRVGGSPAAYSASKRYSSRISPDLSYRVGVSGEKPLSSRWSVAIGLDLHYYSVQLITDERVNSYTPSSASLIQPSAVTYSLSSTNSFTDENRQTFINRYFFLELPVSAQYRINSSRLLPLYWRGGAVFSYLMGSDAEYFDSRSGMYSKDLGIVRHAQVSLSTGVMVGLPVKGVEIRAGPEVQYAVTGMLNPGAGGGHLVYGGMRVALMR